MMYTSRIRFAEILPYDTMTCENNRRNQHEKDVACLTFVDSDAGICVHRLRDETGGKTG